jgi:hypothetical protein
MEKPAAQVAELIQQLTLEEVNPSGKLAETFLLVEFNPTLTAIPVTCF